MSDMLDHGARLEPPAAEAQDTLFKPLTREQAEVLRARSAPLSPWQILAAQAAAGLACTAVVWLLTRNGDATWSALYGAGVVVLPGALMAYGLRPRPHTVSAGTRAIGFMGWALVKVVVAVTLLVLAPRLLQPLVWPALLAGLVLSIKMVWLVLWWRGR